MQSKPGTMDDNPEEELARSRGPTIVVHEPKGSAASAGPSQWIPKDDLRAQSSDESLSSTHESLELDSSITRQSAQDTIPSSIKCTLYATFDGDPVPLDDLAVLYHDANSYQMIEEYVQKRVEISRTEDLIGKSLNFKYGNCTIIGDYVEKIGVPLTTQEDWNNVCTILTNYWVSDAKRSIRLEVFRDYFSFRSRATSDVSFAATKRSEIQALMKRASGGRKYIPRTALMRFTSPENIREIIIRDQRLLMESKEKEAFIQTVQQKASCLLAMCVYAGLKMGCLKKLLDKGCSDLTFPLEDNHCCHQGCEPDFEYMVFRQGDFKTAKFDIKGQHQEFHRKVVIPIHYQPVDVDAENFVTEGRKKGLGENASNIHREGDFEKARACCGSGAYSNVYRVTIDPDHHRLSTNKNVDFALKEFKDRPQRGDADFKQELKVLDKLREYPHKHIVTHLATWTQDGKYYMLFPYAQCNLRQYMRWMQFGVPSKENIIWLLKQMRGLAEAMKNIHNLSTIGLPVSAPSQPPSLRAPQPQMRESGWHHDLKPENILLYKHPGSKRGAFQISDFGSSKVHTYRSGSINTRSPNGTLTYEPPEAKSEGTTSRPYDMWSLGCVFLELLMWAVLGARSVEEFASNRLDRRYPGSQTDPTFDDSFWQMAVDGTVTVRKTVIQWIEGLEKEVLNQAQQPFKEVLESIKCMLKPNPRDRIMALHLWNMLDSIYKQKKLDLKDITHGSLPEGDNDGNASLLPRLSLDPIDGHSPDISHDRPTGLGHNAAYVNSDFLNASPIDSRDHRRNSSGSARSPFSVSPTSRNHSIASSNMSTHGHHGSMDGRENSMDESR